MPNGNVSGRPPLPDGDIPTGDGADGAEGAKITDADDADGTEQPDKNKNGENKKAAPHGVRKNGRHRQNGGRKNASGKLPRCPQKTTEFKKQNHRSGGFVFYHYFVIQAK